MSEENRKEFFDQKIAEQCQSMRLLSLRISDTALQMESLRASHTAMMQTYASQQVELQKLVSLAQRMLGLEGDWICAIDTGKLIPVKPQEGSSG